MICIKDRTDQWNITTATVLLPVCFTLLFYAVAIWRFKRYEAVRYLHFALSLLLVLFFWHGLEEREIYSKSLNELKWLAAGNIFYYSTGIILAFWLKDNRVFCKYLCPIPVLQKIGSRFSLLKIKIDTDKCTNCGICEKNCPMDIKLLEYKQKGARVLSTECIMCVSCISSCPHQVVDLTFGLDGSSVL